MEKASGSSDGKRVRRREVINFSVMLVMFIIYALTFTVPRFYDTINVVYPYAGLVNFFMLIILFVNNVMLSGEDKGLRQILSDLKSRGSREIYLLGVIILTAGINLFIVNSGKGAFFVPVNFILIWYLSDKMYLNPGQLKVFAGIYMGFLIFYLFIAYPGLFTTFENYKYNTNTAATFTIYTLLCAFILLEMYIDRGPIVGLFMVMILLKGFQLSLWHRARGAFIMLVLFMLFWYIVPGKLWRNRSFYAAMCLLATFGSLVFVGLYVLIGTTGANFKLPFFYKEVFSGREAIWKELFGLLANRERPYMIFTGIGTGFELKSFFEKNVHNAMYNFLVIHGLIVFLGIVYFVCKRMQGFHKRISDSRVAMCAMCAVMAVFFESFFDVDLIWADYALNLIFLLCVINSATPPQKEEGSGTMDEVKNVGH